MRAAGAPAAPPSTVPTAAFFGSTPMSGPMISPYGSAVAMTSRFHVEITGTTRTRLNTRTQR
jgi:hypothetical protein